jgi:Protein of unknown function (DUF3311)
VSSPEHRPTPLVTPTRIVVGVLLALPFVGTLWVSLYTRVEPTLGGFPFFYWYQLLWIFLSALFTICAFLLLQRERRGIAAAAEHRRTTAGEEEVGSR